MVGTDRLARAEGGYFIAKHEQERLISASGRPYSLVHATQFFEFVRSITDHAMRGRVAHIADVLVQPMAADDVADAVVRTALADPLHGMIEFGGPEVFSLAAVAAMDLRSRQDEREVVPDPWGHTSAPGSAAAICCRRRPPRSPRRAITTGACESR
ncbi:hypothetical protein [Microbacterium sp. Se63.02b]|uniref:hypothetical protein n=1 Tax=Microbacterium sp. Se63.02b TaxID=2709304 RepID=UPI001FCE86FD|nr:hypothetical protein [Microbacterium sp. Se63.02b]